MTLKALMILPMIGMVLLTVGISFLLIKLRYKAVLEDGLKPAYFKLNKGGRPPDYLVRVTQHYDNMFEAPLLFYVAIVLLVVLDITDVIYVWLSWAYFLSRLAHAYIHTTHNKLRQRRNVFIVSYLIVVILWVRISIELVSI